jgi:hypothetical protein
MELATNVVHLNPPKTQEDLKAFRDTMGRFRTESLFLEKKRNDKFPSYFTLSDFDRDGHISMRRKYLEIADPTEYEVGVRLLGDFKHWQVLCERDWFKEYVNGWRMELQAKLESEAISILKEVATDPKAGGRVQAAKLLVERPWENKDRPLRGRPSTLDKERYLKRAVGEAEEVEADHARLFSKEPF